MPKSGILHDYDLHANLEPAAQKQAACVVCETSPVGYQWSDYSGEAMCMRCGTPYQLKWGSEQQKTEDAYPYLNLRAEWVEPVREYFRETGTFTYLGQAFFVKPTGLNAFMKWAREHHPELFKKPAPPA